jgi:hypothetical protein
MTPEALKQTQDLANRVRGTCATVKLVCESDDVGYQGALLNAEVVERLIHEHLDLARELEDDGAEPDHIAAIHSLIDELEVVEEMLKLKVLALSGLEGQGRG